MTKMYEWLLVLGIILAGIHRFGIVGLFVQRKRGRHCANGRSKKRVHGTHRSKDSLFTVSEILADTGEQHMLPSMYYHELPPSRRGLAHAA